MPTYFSLGFISNPDLIWSERTVRIIDFSIIGIGIETEGPLEPGFVWFKEQLYGQSCGYLVWCKQEGSRSRSGIRFVTLSREQEQYLRHQVERLKPHQPLQDPDRIIESLIKYL